MSAIPASCVVDVDPIHSLDHSADLSDNLGKMFDSGEGCDLLLLVGSELSKEGADVTICAHRVILSQFPRLSASQASTRMTVEVGKSCQQHFIPLIRYTGTNIHGCRQDFLMQNIINAENVQLKCTTQSFLYFRLFFLPSIFKALNICNYGHIGDISSPPPSYKLL